jgi:putative phosphoesterase
MKIAVISDIHSNIQALSSVLREINDENPEYILCIGDLVGYGADPNEVIDELKIMDNLVCVAGNHDNAVVTGNTRKLNQDATEAVVWTQERITDRNLEFLERLKKYQALELENLHFFLVHGSPDDYLNEYIYDDVPEDRLEGFFEDTEAHVLMMGHTHVPFVREVGVNTALNPGSVGQPRDNDRRASYVMVDTEKMEIQVNRVSYDIDDAAESIKKSKLPDSLGERLYYGR